MQLFEERVIVIDLGCLFTSKGSIYASIDLILKKCAGNIVDVNLSYRGGSQKSSEEEDVFFLASLDALIETLRETLYRWVWNSGSKLSVRLPMEPSSGVVTTALVEHHW